jgi:hypothetical protein
MKKYLAIAAFATSVISAFEESPWLDFPYEFHLRSAFKESYYSTIADAVISEGKYEHSWNEEFNLNIGVSTMSMLDLQLEGEFFQTKATTFTLESLGALIRSQIMDDIQGDPFSCTIGTSIRYVPDHALFDPYVPYQGLFNFEANIAFGKEFDEAFDWTKRMTLFLATGLATQGSAYLRFNSSFELHRVNHLFGAVLKTCFGFGGERTVDLQDFHGYGRIRHQSIDLGLNYSYLFDIYGTLSIEALYRVYAFAFPKNFTSIEIRYNFPFSIF